MLKPVTEEEKLLFTLTVQADKAKEELLTELYYQDYEGFVDIWAELAKKKGKLVMEVKSTKLSTSTGRMSHPDAVRYHVLRGKGYKRVR